MHAPKRILDGLYQVGGPGISRPGDCMTYLVDCGEGFVFIDAGLYWDIILSNAENLGYPIEKELALILTHCHIDHVGGAAGLFEPGAMAIAHRDDADAIESGDRVRLALNYYNVDYEPVDVTRKIEGDDMIEIGGREFELVHTPGHTPGSIAVLVEIEGKKVLFGQDIHGPFADEWGSDVAEWRTSMEKLISLEADVLCEGHFGIYTGKEEVKRFIESFF